MEIKEIQNSEFKEGIELLLHNAVLLSTHKSKKFLSYLFDKNILTIADANTTNIYTLSKVKEEFFAILDLFEDKYKEFVDLDFKKNTNTGKFEPFFKVLYPNVIIRNTAGNSHLIRDLVVIHSFHFSHNSVCPLSLKGGRFTKTNLEVMSGYQQSHLPSSSSWENYPFIVSSFCVGGDTDVSRMISEFQVEMDLARYELFLFCVDSMITWESLEGVPYRKMADIKNSTSNLVLSSQSHYEQEVVQKILSTQIPLNLDFYIQDNIYRIKPNLKASNFIKQILLDNYPYSTYKSIIVSKDPDNYGVFLQMDKSEKVRNISIKKDYTIFRGKKIYPKIAKEKSKKEKISITDYIVYPKFLKNVLRSLEIRIYEKAVVKSTIKLCNTSSNANRSTSSDTVLV